MFDLGRYLQDRQAAVERALEAAAPPVAQRPGRLHEAMRYSLLGGGKRLRPILCMAAGEAAGGAADAALMPGVAIECLHTYTLIHDDLPAMDDDTLRRGRPTAHVQYGEANAILAGDALLTLAFELLAQCPAPPPYSSAQLVLELARAAGSEGVAGGQFEDLANEGRAPDAETLEYIHIHKTALLIAAACRIGAMAAGATPAALEALGEFGRLCGLAFQAADDILDATATAGQLGKNPGKDRRDGKISYVALYGVDAARRHAGELIARALPRLEGLPGPTEPLAALARHIVDRNH